MKYIHLKKEAVVYNEGVAPFYRSCFNFSGLTEDGEQKIFTYYSGKCDSAKNSVTVGWKHLSASLKQRIAFDENNKGYFLKEVSTLPREDTTNKDYHYFFS